MSISGPLKIINEGLVLALDAGNSKSYPSTGSTWFDLISGSNNGTLINGAYYTSSQPSYINFDGINDYINFSSSVYPVSGLGFTIEVVGSVDSGSSAPQRFLSKGHYGWTPGYFLGKYPSTDGRIRFVGGIGSATSVSSSAVYCYTSQSYNVGLVRHLSLLSTGTYMYLYVNGAKSNLIKATGTVGTLENGTDLNYSASISGLSIATSAKFSVGNYANSNASILDEYLKGKISLVKIYNRALSYSEILINYNSVKNKYSLSEIVGSGGNSIITSGDYKTHIFTTIGTASFTLASVGSEDAIAVEYLIVGGGGGGGMDMGGGGGGGGVISGTTYVMSPYTATVIVGAGGLGAPAAGTSGQPNSHQYSINAKKGDNSVFATFTAIGGGYGGSSYYDHALGGYPGNGGSGGGASGYSNGGTRTGGTGTVGQGNNGGRGGGQYYSGGGGGAGAAGTDSTSQPNGGAGVQNSILGVSYFWGGGGGGGGYSGNGGNGGNGGGGGGAVGTTTGGSGLNAGSVGGGGSTGGNPQTPGGNGGANTGGGGGGGSHYNANNKGGDGGSGIVVIRYRYLLIQ